jgi:hypothetical protein
MTSKLFYCIRRKRYKFFVVHGEYAKSIFIAHEKMREKIKLKNNKYKGCQRDFSFGDTPVGDEITLHCLFRVTVGEVPV